MPPPGRSARPGRCERFVRFTPRVEFVVTMRKICYNLPRFDLRLQRDLRERLSSQIYKKTSLNREGHRQRRTETKRIQRYRKKPKTKQSVLGAFSSPAELGGVRIVNGKHKQTYTAIKDPIKVKRLKGKIEYLFSLSLKSDSKDCNLLYSIFK